MSQPYEEMNEGYTQVFNDDNKLNKSKRPHNNNTIKPICSFAKFIVITSVSYPARFTHQCVR